MWLRLGLIAALLTPVLHTVALFASGLDAVTSPVGALSHSAWGVLHTLGLVLFGFSHVALALAMAGRDHGRLWPWGRLLLVASGAILFYIAWYFATQPLEAFVGPEGNDPLWIVASLTGLAMGAMQPGLSRLSRGVGLFSAVYLGAWLLLIPLAAFVTDAWIGGYERLVGFIYVTWIVGVASGLMPQRNTAAT